MYVELGRQIFSANLANYGFLRNIYFKNKCVFSVWGAESLTTVDGYVKIMKHVRKKKHILKTKI